MAETPGDIATAGGRLGGSTREPVDASTVLLLRDGADGLEVFLLERHVRSDFAGGAFAFPGGKVDPGDRDLPADRWSGVDPSRVRELVGAHTDADALGLWVAAVRETFEEAGVLLADRDGAPVSDADLASPPFVQARSRLAARGRPWDWRPWLAEQDLVLDLGALAPFAWWVTPHGMHKRFDTRFFAAVAPPSQLDAPRHDDVETTASRWSRPADALAAAERGDAVIIFPTRHTLRALDRYATAQEVVAAGAARRTDVRRILPAVHVVGGVPHVRHPDGGPAETV